MPRWYALCRGNGIAACAMCKRFVANNGGAMHEMQQAFIAPDFAGSNCEKFIECPPYQLAAITPSDKR